MKKNILVWGICLLVVHTAMAAVVFEDDFTVDNGNWLTMSIQNSSATRSVSGGVLTIVSTGTIPAFVKHDMVLTGDYTYTVDITTTSSTYSLLGIYSNGTTTLNGYTLLINANQQYQLYKMTLGSSSTLNASVNSFLNVATNKLVISKSGSTITAFCNGKTVATATDGSYSGGFIGLIVPSGVTAQFDNVVVTNTSLPAVVPPVCYNDNFDDGNLEGWYTARVGSQASGTGGKLVMAIGSSEDGFIYTNGQYDTASVKTIVNWNSGTGFYGVGMFDMQTTSTGFSTKVLSFSIAADLTYAIFEPDQMTASRSGSWSQIHGSTTGGTGIRPDTLAILYRSGNYIFYVNDDSLATIAHPSAFVPEGVGLYVFTNTTVSFDDLLITNTPWIDCTGVRSITPSARNTFNVSMRLQPSSSVRMVNLMGRSIMESEGFTGFSSGKYLLVNKKQQRTGAWLSIR